MIYAHTVERSLWGRQVRIDGLHDPIRFGQNFDDMLIVFHGLEALLCNGATRYWLKRSNVRSIIRLNLTCGAARFRPVREAL